jgi:pimeloyl-ACP methyl ester carboxylesterase
VIGHDWGGYASFLLALERPERVERVLALDITPGFGHRGCSLATWLFRCRRRTSCCSPHRCSSAPDEVLKLTQRWFG